MWTIITNWSNGTFETIITQPTKKQNLVDLCQLLCRIWCQKYQNDWFEFGRQDKINADSEKNVWFEVCKSQRVECFELKQIRIEWRAVSSALAAGSVFVIFFETLQNRKIVTERWKYQENTSIQRHTTK